MDSQAGIRHCGVNQDVYVYRMPGLHASVVIVSNHRDYTRRGQRIVDRIMGSDSALSRAAAARPNQPSAPDTQLLNDLAGRYIRTDGKSYSSHVPVFDQCTIRHISDTLRYYYQPDQFIHLEAIGATTFRETGWGTEFHFNHPAADSAWQLEIRISDGTVEQYRQAGDAGGEDAASMHRLDDFIGRYYSPHLDYTFTILWPDGDGPLLLHRPTITDKTLEYFGPDQFLFMMESGRNGGGWKVRMQFIRDEAGQISGFDLQHIRMMKMHFDKVTP